MEVCEGKLEPPPVYIIGVWRECHIRLGTAFHAEGRNENA